MTDTFVIWRKRGCPEPSKGRLFIPCRLKNPLNQRAGWRAVWAHSKVLRGKSAEYARLSLPRDLFADPTAPKRITFRAHVWRLFDTDEGLNASLKPIRDGLGPPITGTRMVKGRRHIVSAPGAGIVHSDGPGCGHLFVYEQIVDRKNLGVEVVVEITVEEIG